MKKATFIILAALLMVLLASFSAVAVPAYYHGDFGGNSAGCGKCHVTHAGSASALLVSGPTQTDFCFYCHGDLASSPYDALNGQLKYNGNIVPSLAGGFDQTFDFDTQAYDPTVNTAAGLVGSSSAHEVQTYRHQAGGVLESDAAYNVWVDGTLIPGGASDLVGDFECGSCHDPHAGGAYPAAGVMPRLLKTNLYVANAGTAAATMQDWVFSGVNTVGGYNSKYVTTYGANAGLWCVGCHDLFNVTVHNATGGGSGQAVQNGAQIDGDRYMHRVNFTLNDLGVAGTAGLDRTYLTNGAGNGDQNKIERLALSAGNQLTCLTCHRAHGTGSTMDVSLAAWNRANLYLEGSVNAGGENQRGSSVLLREQDRDVCYNCHGAAVANTPVIQTN